MLRAPTARIRTVRRGIGTHSGLEVAHRGGMPAVPSRRLPRCRKRLRRLGFDYRTPGAYFITIVAWHRTWIFGEVVDRKMRLAASGELVWQSWLAIPTHCPGIRFDAFVVMPDHVHGIVVIDGGPMTLGQVVNLFKAASTRAVNRHRGRPGVPIWQRGFHDRIIRDDDEWVRIARYIDDNPRQWRDRPALRLRPARPS